MFEKDMLIPQAHIGHLNEDHKYLQDNEYIHSGYRLYFNTVSKILKSLFMWHNEAVNIWSHLLGFVLFLILLVYSIAYLQISGVISIFSTSANGMPDYSIDSVGDYISPLALELKSQIDSKDLDWMLPQLMDTKLHDVSRWPIFVFIISAMICLLMSTIYHLCGAHSRRIYALTSRLDYAGISILICGSFFPPIYYIYFCKEGKVKVGLIILYLTGISLFCGAVFVVSLFPAFQKPKYRCFRGSIFLVLGLTALVPCINLCFISNTSKFATGLYCYLGMALCYIVGVLIYILRFPERYFPGKLDSIGNSHNIWHMFVLSACVFHYIGAIENYYSRQHLICSN